MRRKAAAPAPHADPCSFVIFGASADLTRRLLVPALYNLAAAANRLFYLATPPDLFAPIGSRLGSSGLAREAGRGWRRVIVEKPFGVDLASARALNRTLLEVLGEDQIYRIDHYLGKETVQ